MDAKTIIDKVHRMAQVAIPELIAPLYLFLEQPSWMPEVEHAQGWTLPPGRVLWNVRQDMIDRSEWRGSGPMIWLLPDCIDGSGSYWEPHADILRVAAHELGHVTERVDAWQGDPTPPKGHIEQERELLLKWATDPEVCRGERERQQIPWENGHGLDFIRRTLHVTARAWDAGFNFSIDIVCAGQRYGLSNPSLYMRALGDEPDRLRHETFATIAATPPPRAFTELFERDTRPYLDWLAAQPTEQTQ